MAVARQKLPHAKRSGTMCRPDEHDVAKPARHHLDTAQDERAQHDLADFRVELQEAKQLISLELDDVAVFVRADAHERPASGEEIGFASELAWPIDRNEHLAGARC